MSRGGNITMTIDFDGFYKSLHTLLDHVERGTKKATIQACEDIKELTLAQVPRDSGGLAESFYYEVHGSYRNFTAELGYGGNGDPVNPRTGKRASDYMVQVHEDLEAHHEVGKAKYLEDPLREYKSRFVSRVGVIIRSETGL